MDKQNGIPINQSLDQLSHLISKAIALTAVGASAEMEDYRGEILNHYFDTVLDLLHDAKNVCHRIDQEKAVYITSQDNTKSKI